MLRLESNSTRQSAIILSVAAIGCLLMYLARGFDASSFSNTVAAFLLGVLLFGIALAGALFGGKRVITMDSARTVILVQAQNLFRKRVRRIQYNEVVGVEHTIQRPRAYTPSVHNVVLHLRHGEVLSLLGADFFNGRYSYDVTAETCRKVWNEISASRSGGATV